MRSLRLPPIASLGLILVISNACGGSKPHDPSARQLSTTMAPKVSYAHAMSSGGAASAACATLLGDGNTQGLWLAGVGAIGDLKVQSEADKTSTDSPALVCSVSSTGGADSRSLRFVQGEEAYTSQLRDARGSTSIPDRVAGAWNPDSQIGAISEDVAEGRNQTATADLQTLVNRVGK